MALLLVLVLLLLAVRTGPAGPLPRSEGWKKRSTLSCRPLLAAP